MSLIGLFTKKTRYIGDIEIDAIISEVNTNSVTLTNNPVEFGADITDHAIIQPKTYKITGIISDILSNPLTNIIQQVSGLIQSVTTGATANRSKLAYQDLLTLMQDREPFDILTGQELINNCILTALRADRDLNSSNMLLFEATLQQVIIVTNKEIHVDPDKFKKSDGTQSQAMPSPLPSPERPPKIPGPLPVDQITAAQAKSLKEILGKNVTERKVA